MGVVGGRKAGKSALIDTFQGESGGRTVRSVGGRMVAFRVSESRSIDEVVNVDVLLLCFSIGAPLSALPRPHSRPQQPLVLVGCKADLRRKARYTLQLMRIMKMCIILRIGNVQPLVGARQALALCRQLGGVMYVETEATSPASALAAFEVAALAFLGHFVPPPPPPPSSVVSPLLGIESRASSVPRLCASSTDVFASSASTNEFWERFKSPVLRRKTALQRLSSLGSLGNISLPGSSREANFPSGRPMRHQERRGSVEPLVTIKCQRMNSDRRREEVTIINPTYSAPLLDI